MTLTSAVASKARLQIGRLRQLLGYSLAVGSSAIVTLITIPIVVDRAGPTAWASLALGQAVGTGCAIVVGFGWGITGPTQVAISAEGERVRLYSDSLLARSALVLPILIAAVSFTRVAAHTYKLEAGIAAAAFTLTGLLAGWYFTGAAKPYSLLVFETAPRVMGTAAGAVALLMGAGLVAFPLLQLLGVMGSIAASTGKICGWRVREIVRPGRSVWPLLRAQSRGLFIAGGSAIFTTAPISIVALVAPSGLPTYALADRVLRFSMTAFAPFIQVLQGWVPRSDLAVTRRRIRVALTFGGLSISLAAALFVAALPRFATLLSRGQIRTDFDLSLPFGITLGSMLMAQVTGLVCLIALGRSIRLAQLTVLSVSVGIPSVLVGALLFGVHGAAWALAFSELFSLALQIILLLSVINWDGDQLDEIQLDAPQAINGRVSKEPE